MEEGEVTVDGSTHGVPRPFMVLATQNPVEQEGTYRLPEAQLDRFMIKLSVGYPDHDAEVAMLESVGTGHKPADIESIVQIGEVARMIGAVRTVHLTDAVRSYIVRLCQHTRTELPEARLGVSPRGSLALMSMGRALAASQARNYVNIDDIRIVAPYVMGHRLLLTPNAELDGVSVLDLVDRTIAAVPAPDPVRN